MKPAIMKIYGKVIISEVHQKFIILNKEFRLITKEYKISLKLQLQTKEVLFIYKLIYKSIYNLYIFF